MRPCRRLGDGSRDLHRLAARDRARHDAVDQRAARSLADDGQHVGFVCRFDADMAGDELAVVFKVAEGAGGLHQHRGLRNEGLSLRT
jgi:hypothetical protein